MSDIAPPDGELPAGDFSSWLMELDAALRGHSDSKVPCGSCYTCCTSSQFIHIAPDETDTLAHIDARLLFPAPGAPRGHVLLGYDERGHCPMLVENRCTIYAHRPRTCRTYDCRAFPAAGLTVADMPENQQRIGQHADRWRFRYHTKADRTRQQAVVSAARYLREHTAELPPDSVPNNPTQLAVLAILVHQVFIHDEKLITPTLDVVRAKIAAPRR